MRRDIPLCRCVELPLQDRTKCRPSGSILSVCFGSENSAFPWVMNTPKYPMNHFLNKLSPAMGSIEQKSHSVLWDQESIYQNAYWWLRYGFELVAFWYEAHWQFLYKTIPYPATWAPLARAKREALRRSWRHFGLKGEDDRRRFEVRGKYFLKFWVLSETLTKTLIIGACFSKSKKQKKPAIQLNLQVLNLLILYFAEEEGVITLQSLTKVLIPYEAKITRFIFSFFDMECVSFYALVMAKIR